MIIDGVQDLVGQIDGKIRHCGAVLPVHHSTTRWEGAPGSGAQIEEITLRPCPSCKADVVITVRSPD